ncbi:MAG: carboxypeptidase-like regulatory domain-containing protein [Bacteroidota bacterium]
MKNHIIFLLIAVWGITFSFGQQSGIRGSVSDAETGEPLAYATLIHVPSGRGTATNNQGAFVMPYAREGDSIRISYIGFETQWFVVSSRSVVAIQLRPQSTTLDEVVINPDDNDFLYNLVIKAKKNGNRAQRTAKTYFFLETLLDGEHSEMIEAYFNGQFNGYQVENLSMKKGRVGMKAVNGRFFISTESSRAFILHNPFLHKSFYPDNPLVFSKRSMKKHYDLAIEQIYNEKGAKIYVVDCQPREDTLGLFRTKLWIDLTHEQIVKTRFSIKGTNRHPFEMIGYQRAKQVDMDFSRTYEQVGEELRLSSVDFTYKVGYQAEGEKLYEAFTRAYLKVYDYEVPFQLPFFNFSTSPFKDYRDITVAPYDDTFWEKIDEFRFYDRTEEVNAFMRDHRLSNDFNNLSIEERDHQQLGFSYVSWRPDRILMRDPDPRLLAQYPPVDGLETDRYALNIKLYLDASFIHGSLVYQLNTIIDPVSSKYHFVMDGADHAFVNMSMDLMEIQKRKLEKALKKKRPKTMQEVQALYQEHLEKYAFQNRIFQMEVLRGRNRTRMKKWNVIIKDELGVDNLSYFSLEEDAEE